jgi:hypothetical protein
VGREDWLELSIPRFLYIYPCPTAIRDDFVDWVGKHPDQPQITKDELEKFLEKRTWSHHDK